ncbi:putative intracellular protease/amidase [Thermosporothrix hazakensis]|jgi:putative intracellular protease/amidase|uniref:Putative intracellular protease/amidase n=2 Tax=Thermosporothrix TaxID=768650 RepID=A0A326UB78_THEHA|nr:type 1 glutamine amidotransferase family protein [Thermosporothrix hazakensis]PZW34516.1 putative intracellular protease/amidase [Thermosporothrix hazakensis]BBH85639.1 putative protease YoaZ [Thermosporothrix sp. COM3]GCE45932.1 putative protease YoaZ [Thermosporothrix hazakensis]
MKVVHLFVYPTLADWEYGYAVAGLNTFSGGRYQVKTVGMSREPVVSLGGVTIVPDMTLAELTPEESSMLILPGGEGWETGMYGDALEMAQRFLAAGVPVAAICGATAGLASVGLLNERKHTSNAPEFVKIGAYRGEALYQAERAVADGKLITAGGVSPLEFAREIFQMLELFSEDALEAWYMLYKTGESRYFIALQQAMQA